MNFPLLSLLVWLPVLGGAAVLLFGKTDKLAQRMAEIIAGLTLFLCLPLILGFDSGSADYQFVERFDWIPFFSIQYYLGVDGISMPLVALTALMSLIVIILAKQSVSRSRAQYLAAFLVMEGLMIGVFAALDSLFFYLFFEAMLIPMFLIIGIWGGPNRVYATIKFFLYTFLGSIFMLIALIYMRTQAGSFEIAAFYDLPLSMTAQGWIFFAFLIAFAVKVPMWPVHTWLPDAHVEAPTGGSVILAAITLKIGGYGFLRFIMPIVPDAANYFAPFVITISLVAIVYISFIALAQRDMKKLVAYSSIAHMGFVTLGFFLVYSLLGDIQGSFDLSQNTGELAAAQRAVTGSMIQMISHGFISGAMFMCIGVLYDRIHSREIADYGGVLSVMPKYGAFAIFFSMANAGLPGTSGFVGEFLVILSAIQANFWIGFLAAMTLILGAAYSLWLVKRVYLGPVVKEKVKALLDLSSIEFWLLSLLAIMVLWVGLYPAALVNVMSTSIDQVLVYALSSKL